MNNNNRFNHSIQNELQVVWRKDFSLRRLFEEIQKVNNDIAECISSNGLHNEKRFDFSNSLQNRCMSYLPLAAALVDYTCAHYVLGMVIEHIVFIPEWLAILIICLTILFLEISFGLFLTRKGEPRDYTEEINSNPSIWKQPERLKIYFFRFLGCLFILIIPIMSLVEYFEQVAVNDMLVQYGQLSLEAKEAANKSLKIKYILIGLMSFISHAYVVFFTRKIADSFAQLKFDI